MPYWCEKSQRKRGRHTRLCVYIKIKSAQTTQTSSVTGGGQHTASSLFQPQRNGIALSRGAQGNNLAVAGGEREGGFFGEKKRGCRACCPTAGSSVTPSQPPRPICQKPDVQRWEEMLRSHLPDLEGKAVKHPETIANRVLRWG